MRFVDSNVREMTATARLGATSTVVDTHHVILGGSLSLFVSTDELSQLVESLSDVLGEVRVRDVRVMLGVAQ
ncbi:MAG: hypothetical protein ACO3S5_11605 [Ilumatobacteraceae bacterium]